MWKFLAWLVLLLPCTGCVIEETHGRHRTRAAVVAPGHVHCVGCGHVYRGGLWVDID